MFFLNVALMRDRESGHFSESKRLRERLLFILNGTIFVVFNPINVFVTRCCWWGRGREKRSNFHSAAKNERDLENVLQSCRRFYKLSSSPQQVSQSVSKSAFQHTDIFLSLCLSG